MNRPLLLDDEQQYLLALAINATAAKLSARAARVDPEGIISATVELADRKLQNIDEQLKRGDLPTWNGMKPSNRDRLRDLMHDLAHQPDPILQDALWAQIVAAVFGSE